MNNVAHTDKPNLLATLSDPALANARESLEKALEALPDSEHADGWRTGIKNAKDEQARRADLNEAGKFIPATVANMEEWTDIIGSSERQAGRLIVYSPTTGEQFSANPSDYFAAEPGEALVDAEGDDMVLAVVKPERVEPITFMPQVERHAGGIDAQTRWPVVNGIADQLLKAGYDEMTAQELAGFHVDFAEEVRGNDVERSYHKLEDRAFVVRVTENRWTVVEIAR